MAQKLTSGANREGQACAKVLGQDCVWWIVFGRGWYLWRRVSKWESGGRWGQRESEEIVFWKATEQRSRMS